MTTAHEHIIDTILGKSQLIGWGDSSQRNYYRLKMPLEDYVVRVPEAKYRKLNSTTTLHTPTKNRFLVGGNFSQALDKLRCLYL